MALKDTMRIQKYLSACGEMSRRAAEKAVADGRVTVNGEPAAVLKDLGVLCVEMEAYALYLNAARAGKNALALLTISDNVFTGESLSPQEVRETFTQMMEIALEIA